MKLKKIASLALAGVMAVSMLAGCKDGGNSNSGSSSENTNTATGYSAVLESYMSDDVKDMDYVTFQDNASDGTALQNAAAYVTQQGIETALNGLTIKSIHDWNTDGHADMVTALEKAYDVKDDDLNPNISFDNWNDGADANRNLSDAVVYAANGSIGVNEALKMIADELDGYIENMPEKSNVTVGTWNYNYVISVSVVNKPLTSYTTYNGSINYIAVTVTRTATQG